jgi:uncharacterized protein (TIGR03083 family)
VRTRLCALACWLWTCGAWREERADFAAFLAALPPGQWEAPSLCAGWRVRDVVAHVISYDELGTRGLLECAVRGRFWSRRINAVALARYDSCGPEQLLELLRAHLEPRGLMAALGGRVALTEGVIHHQDVRRALGYPRAVPPERLLVALRWALLGPDIGGFGESAGCAWSRRTCRFRPGRGRRRGDRPRRC